MLINGSRLKNYPVLSLHVGGKMAQTTVPIIDPRKMQIVGFYVDGPLVNKAENGDILETKMIREFSNIGMIIDSLDDLTSEGEVVKLDEVLNIGFQLEGKKVVTKKKSKLGKVIDYTVDPESFLILQIIVQCPPVKAFLDPELVISRKEIVEITDDRIIVKDEEEKIKKKAAKEDFVPNFVNPFREPNFAKADSQTPGGQDN